MDSRARRRFLKMAGGSLGAALAAGRIPDSIARALSIPPGGQTGTLADVEHVVILMQENRSFDHYFGGLAGVRGFGDPRPALLPDGTSVWHQPNARVRTDAFKPRGVDPRAPSVLPFHIDVARSGSHFDSTDHGWSSGHQAWNLGRWDDWVTQKQDPLTMGYLDAGDLPFHTALAEAFTLCDSYFCSAHSDTAINRIYLWSGTCDTGNVLGPRGNGPGLEERAGHNGYSWTTYPERLQQAGISWRVYQGGTGEPGSPTDNYTDNSLEFFAAYQVQEGADPDGELVRRGTTDRDLGQMRQDVLAGRLPQVSWVVAPFKYCEHPAASQDDGAYYIDRVLDALTADPEVWSKTVLLINYDENDGLFDHVVPPMPPLESRPNGPGLVSEDLAGALEQDILDLDRFPRARNPLVPGADPGGRQPVGLGPRVPMLVISPWSTGGWVCSQTFDHTSVIRFLEARFGVMEPNIGAWRRSICGDLTSAFDFTRRQRPLRPRLAPAPPQPLQPQPLQVPAQGEMPVQAAGLRPARALPYRWSTTPRLTPEGRLEVAIDNPGGTGVAFYIHDALQPQSPPRRYAVSAGKRIADTWELHPGGYALRLYGPNGSLAEIRDTDGDAGGIAGLEACLRQPDASRLVAEVQLANQGDVPLLVRIDDAYDEGGARELQLQPGQRQLVALDTAAHHGWHDIAVTLPSRPGFLRRYAGHLENGGTSTSDPGPRRPHLPA
ncbi:phosphocholine-specific phospholipase C [Xanthomonas massiliensis]|uniref:phosphocholine-specific phospholipase C n=1 Tax=Xanthomonas massiliensis TaxID=1720302 RepID=UPI0008263C26|nr:phospholipase C, phosphocholine-specific [Xanthomonas massiliensis]